MPIGVHLTKAMEWFNRAVRLEAEGKSPAMIDKCTAKMIEEEKLGLAAGESWD